MEGLDHRRVQIRRQRSIAAEEVARAAPDGYTWLLVTTFFTASPALNAALRWDPVQDFIPVGQICRAPNFFIVPATLPVKSVAEYVALAKAKPGTLNYSHPGKGSTGHLGFELFKRLAGIDVTGIGYRGYPQMVPDIASGLITSTFLSANQALAQVQTGAIRIIGAINDGRSKYFPDVPTMAEQGFAEAQVTPWFGVVVPAGTPQPVVERISRALEAALATPDASRNWTSRAAKPGARRSGQFAGIIKADVALWARVVKEAGITADEGWRGKRAIFLVAGAAAARSGAVGAAAVTGWPASLADLDPACSPRAEKRRILRRIGARSQCHASELPSNSPRMRSFSFSIGQLTFGSFLLVLAVIIITSTASVIAIRHIDPTFGELQRLQSVGDLAEDIDRRMNELRLAARDFVTDPGTQSIQVAEAATSLTEVLKKTRLELAPEQQDMIDGVTERLSTYRSGIERISALINRRADLIVALPPLREKFDAAIADSPDPFIASALFQTQSRIASALLARNPSAAELAAQSMRSMPIPEPNCARPSTITPRRSSTSRSGSGRSPTSTRRCWAPRAA